MKSRILTYATATTLLVALAIPVWLSGQDDTIQTSKPKHHHYKLVDIGLGGPQSAVFEFLRTLNNRGVLVGMAETSTPDPSYPNFTPFIGFGNPDPFIQHAFIWQDGVLIDLGALINSSQADCGKRERGSRWSFRKRFNRSTNWILGDTRSGLAGRSDHRSRNTRRRL